MDAEKHLHEIFLSTPSARRATEARCARFRPADISIHALREEGDARKSKSIAAHHVFLSTPSARRATCIVCAGMGQINDFYPRPPRGGRRCTSSVHLLLYTIISIHALREEGDSLIRYPFSRIHEFLSTPSARRATVIGFLILVRICAFLSTPSARRATGTVESAC